MTTTRKLLLPGKTPRIWRAELDDGRLAITSGTAKKATTKEESFEQPHKAEEKYVAELLKKLRSGYVLDGAQGALVGQFLVSEQSVSSITPDGETVWDVEAVTAKVHARASGEVLATHDLRALGIPEDFVADVVALSRDAALFACASTDVWKLDSAGLRVFAKAQGCTGRLRVGGDRVLLRGHRDRATVFDLEGTVVFSLENVQHAALSDDGRYLATCAPDGGELVVWNAKDGAEVQRCSFGAGRGAHDVAIDSEHVAGLSVYFPGAGRHAFLAFSIAGGEPVLTNLFGDLGSGIVEALTTNGFAVGSGSFFSGDDPTPLLEHVEFSRLARTHSAHVASGGRFVLSHNEKGIVAVWDTSLLPRSAPKVEGPSKPRLPAPSTDWAVPPAPAPRVTEDALVIPFANEPTRGVALPGGILYSSYVDDVSTFVDLTSYPPRVSSRMVVLGAARSPSGMFALQHRDGLWLTRDFSERGQHLMTPGYADVVGFLGEAPMLFDMDGNVAPLIWLDGAWKEVTGLHSMDATGGTGAVNLSDGFGFITFRDAAWHVDAQARATKLFDMTDVNPSWTFPTIDGRAVCPLPAGKLVFYSRDGRKLVMDVTEKKKASLGVQPMPGPNRSLLVTLESEARGKAADFIGAQVPLSGGKPTLLTRADFGITAGRISELLMCGDEVLARVDGNVFHRMKRK